MYSLVCQNILLAPGDREVAGGAGGLFHSLDKDEGDDGSSTMDISLIKTLVSKCATSSDLNMREAAAVDLLDVLTEDEDEEAGLTTHLAFFLFAFNNKKDWFAFVGQITDPPP